MGIFQRTQYLRNNSGVDSLVDLTSCSGPAIFMVDSTRRVVGYFESGAHASPPFLAPSLLALSPKFDKSSRVHG
jgi:hypothetical protein